jgi:NAD(P)-dependent dehydrogenase (short-subunit alcohol dehydrogenase family)
MTTSSSGLYGTFGQSNQGVANMALVDLMQTRAPEGARPDIRVNCIVQTSATKMLDGLRAQDLDLRQPGFGFASASITLTPGAALGTGPHSASARAAAWNNAANRSGETVSASGAAQGAREPANAGYRREG